ARRAAPWRSKFDRAPRLQRLAQRDADASGFARIAQRERRRSIVLHGLDEFQRFAQERLLEALVERRRALVAHPVGVRDVDAVQPWVLAHCEATLRAEDL